AAPARLQRGRVLPAARKHLPRPQPAFPGERAAHDIRAHARPACVPARCPRIGAPIPRGGPMIDMIAV
ncbi:hypothetical protein, partial [Burkholderia territorii]